jgi:ubiquinone/menaquinone biosynthesis C-methylase UbiE
MELTPKQIAEIICSMRDAYGRGENAMDWCRQYLRVSHNHATGNDLFSTLVAYDLQAGSYISAARRDTDNNRRWCVQLAGLLASAGIEGGAILEVGVGEATTLAGVLRESRCKPAAALGFDISWSRVSEGKRWLEESGQNATLFVGDLLNIPLADGSVDIVYSSHSLEPNRGKEEPAIRECLRVARKAVVLVEPIYELASVEAQSRMRHHGYVEGLKETAERLGAVVADYRLLDYSTNPLNPSGVLYLKKPGFFAKADGDALPMVDAQWRCPVTGVKLEPKGDCYYAPEVGLAYPVLRGIPMLRVEHGIVASKLDFPTTK